MAKDFYRMNSDGDVEHCVVMGITRYEKFYKEGWKNHIPTSPSVSEDINPFEGIEDDEDTSEEIKAKARAIAEKRKKKAQEKPLKKEEPIPTEPIEE
jgi:hypothetical protein